MPPQDLDRQRVERAHPGHPLGLLAQHAVDAILHLARGLVGEGHRQNLMRPRPVLAQQMHDPRRQGLGLARACTRQHQDRPVQRPHRLQLGAVQAVQVVRRSAHPPPRQRLLRQRHSRGGWGGSRRKGLIFVPSVHSPSIAGSPPAKRPRVHRLFGRNRHPVVHPRIPSQNRRKTAAFPLALHRSTPKVHGSCRPGECHRCPTSRRS